MSIEHSAEQKLPKGTVIKVDGLPYELLADTPVSGERYGEITTNGPAESASKEDHS